MNIHLQYVVPPFLENPGAIQSDVWNNDIRFESGKSYLLRASSGKGKSTIMGYLFGVRSGYSGKIFLQQEDTAQWTNAQWSALRKNNLGCMFQELRLFEMLTVRENLQLKMALQSNYQMHDASMWLEELGLQGMLERRVETLSLGQQQRVALVRTLLQPLNWLLLDEPFSHLDKENTAKCLALIQRVVGQQQAGMIMTSLGETYESHFNHVLEL